jgi:activator of HSP90 ATPase
MPQHTNCGMPARLATRRQAIVGASLAMGGLFSGLKSWGQASPAMTAKPSAAADSKRTALHQEVDFNASPRRLYEAILDSKQFAAFSGMAAEIKREDGGAFTMFGGLIVGRNIELAGFVFAGAV